MTLLSLLSYAPETSPFSCFCAGELRDEMVQKQKTAENLAHKVENMLKVVGATIIDGGLK